MYYSFRRKPDDSGVVTYDIYTNPDYYSWRKMPVDEHLPQQPTFEMALLGVAQDAKRFDRKTLVTIQFMANSKQNISAGRSLVAF